MVFKPLRRLLTFLIIRRRSFHILRVFFIRHAGCRARRRSSTMNMDMNTSRGFSTLSIFLALFAFLHGLSKAFFILGVERGHRAIKPRTLLFCSHVFISNCATWTASTASDQRYMVANDFKLPCTSRRDLLILSIVSTGHFPLASAHGCNGCGIHNQQVCDYEIFHSGISTPHIECYSNNVLLKCFRAKQLSSIRMIINDRFSFKTAKGTVIKDIFWTTLNMNNSISATINFWSKFFIQVLLNSNARNRNILTHQEAFRRHMLGITQRHISKNNRAIYRFHFYLSNESQCQRQLRMKLWAFLLDNLPLAFHSLNNQQCC